MESKKCTKCGELKLLEDYFKSKKYKDGHRSQCKVCESKANLARQSKYNRTDYYKCIMD